VFVLFLANQESPIVAPRDKTPAASAVFSVQSPQPQRGRPFRVLAPTVRHLQSIAFFAAKALTLIGISTPLPGTRTVRAPGRPPSRARR